MNNAPPSDLSGYHRVGNQLVPNNAVDTAKALGATVSTAKDGTIKISNAGYNIYFHPVDGGYRADGYFDNTGTHVNGTVYLDSSLYVVNHASNRPSSKNLKQFFKESNQVKSDAFWSALDEKASKDPKWYRNGDDYGAAV